ncbi:PREDICTED: glucose 1-dehydrogenase-like [Papilio xuthus]|uniref:Glucose 1-dehydrogenase n=1 Tax=Papilio xuthus TaxID=66420 RepID=A0A194Q286_PAPXU|nr:PREDICTED: glucose 1-dehydrogenase-like [Papilio xuthus]KPI99448.1 Glucose 1-dehydrogenase [Papilio xuthus]
MSFENKVVIITGASSGIGAATAVLFSKEKANVVLVGRNETKLESVAALCETKHLVVKADVSKEEEAIKIVEQTVDEFGKIDVLVNNAGVSRYGSVGYGNILKAYDEVMATNMRAAIILTSLCAKHIISSKGNVINVSSVLAVIPPNKPGLLPYCISKAALNLFTQGVALDLGKHGVRVNTVSPGPVRTDIIVNSGIPESKLSWADFAANTVLKRVGEPEEIADLIVYLASDKAKSITGSNFVADNGFTWKR